MSEAGPQRWTARAWAPAHLTGFFEIRDEHLNPYRKGSRGAGLNLELGVTATVTIDAEATGRRITIDGADRAAPTVAATLTGLLGDDYPAAVHVALESGLPSGQGFGLSGAGALATALAVAELLRVPTKTALWEAHKAEVQQRTGLGDVPAQFLGGAEIRITPGPLPMGVIERFAGLEARRSAVVCCVLDGEISTAAVLGDPERRARINAAGAASVEALRAAPTLATYARLAADFADRIGLIDDALSAALKEARRHGWASQTMLGNALHLILDPKEPGHSPADVAAAALADHGQVWTTRVSARGARVLPAV